MNGSSTTPRDRRGKSRDSAPAKQNRVRYAQHTPNPGDRCFCSHVFSVALSRRLVMTPWLRLWVDMPNDPKFRTVARVAKQPIALVLATYVHLLVSASSNATERGRTQPNALEDIASALEVSDEQIAQIWDAMQGRLRDADLLTGWSKRQPLREDGSALRAKEHREKQRRLSDEHKQTQPNAEKHPEVEVEVEDKSKAKSRSPTKKLAPSGTRFALTALPPEWMVFCQSERSDLDPLATFARFHDHWISKPGAAGRKLDWLATWRNWVRNERPAQSVGKYAGVIAGLTGRKGPARAVNMGDVVDVPSRLVG